MPDCSLLVASPYLSASNLGGKQVTLTIERMSEEDVPRPNSPNKLDRKWVIRFVETDRSLIVCKVVSELIAVVLGRDFSTWPGHKITLFPTTTIMQGEAKPAIRVAGSPEFVGHKEVRMKDGQGKEKVKFQIVNTGKADAISTPAANASKEN